MPLVPSAVAAGLGVAGGGAFTVWFGKWMLQRMVAQYDKQHIAHEQRIDQLAHEVRHGFNSVVAKLAAVEVRAAEVTAMRQDVTNLVRDTAVNEAYLKKMQTDLNEVWRRQKLRAANEGKT